MIAAMPDLPSVRASDADRERVVTELRDHHVAGRLTLEELAARADQAYAARTTAELDAALGELPAAAPASAAPADSARKTRRTIVAIMSGAVRRGRWRVPQDLRVVTVMGGCELDFRQAVIDADEVTVTVTAVMGGVEISVPEGVEVDLGGFSLMGGVAHEGRDVPPRPGTPLLLVRAFTFMGGVEVRHVPPRGDLRALRGSARA